MSFNFNVDAMKSELANGVSMDELAKAMTDALNKAQKEYEAEEAKRKEAEAQKAKEQELKNVRESIKSSFIAYMKLAMPELYQICDEKDWKELDLMLDQSFNELENCFKMVLPLLNLESKVSKIKPTPDTTYKKPDTDALNRFLRENGLM